MTQKRNTNPNLTKRISIPSSKEMVYHHLDEISKTANMSEYIVELIWQDMQAQGKVEKEFSANDVVKQLDVLMTRLDKIEHKIDTKSFVAGDAGDAAIKPVEEESAVSLDDLMDFGI